MKTLRKDQLTAILLLFSCTIFWGLGFIFTPMAQNAGLTSSLICFLRFSSASIVYGLIFCKKIKVHKSDLKYGFLSGISLASAFCLLALGQLTTTPSNSAFLTGMTVVFLPFLYWIFSHKKPNKLVYLSLGMFVVGIAILSFVGSKATGFTIGDWLTLGSALSFAFHYVIADKGLEKTDTPTFNFIQLASAALILGVFFVLFEMPAQLATPIDWVALIIPMGSLSLLSTVYAYSVESHAQSLLPPYQVSIILNLETVLGATFSVLFGFELFKWNIVIGGVIMFAAVLIAQFAPLITSKKRNRFVIPMVTNIDATDSKVAKNTEIEEESTEKTA